MHCNLTSRVLSFSMSTQYGTPCSALPHSVAVITRFAPKSSGGAKGPDAFLPSHNCAVALEVRQTPNNRLR